MIDSPDIWLTLSEASNITGKSAESLRKMIKRGKLLRVKKISGERGKQWVIHQEEIERLDRQPMTNVQGGHKGCTRAGQIDFISVEHYDKQREKWEEEKTRLVQGLLMYRFKFEEIEKKIKLLPAPPDIIVNEFDKVKKELDYKEKKLNETNSKIFKISQTLEQLKSDREQLELLLKDTQKCHENVQSERNILYSEVEQFSVFRNKLQEEKNKIEEELQSVRMKVQMSQEQTRKLSNQIDELIAIKIQSEEKMLLSEQERKIIEEKLKKKEDEYRTLQINLENRKNRVWWKKLFGIE